MVGKPFKYIFKKAVKYDSEPMQAFIKGLLAFNPHARLTAADICEHPYFEEARVNFPESEFSLYADEPAQMVDPDHTPTEKRALRQAIWEEMRLFHPDLPPQTVREPILTQVFKKTREILKG